MAISKPEEPQSGLDSGFKDQLAKQTMVANLGIGQIDEDFQGEDKISDADMLGWLSAATGMGSAIGGLVPGAGEGISMGFDILGGVFDILAENLPDGTIDITTIESGIGSIINASTISMDRTLKIATGGGESDADYDSLPVPKSDTYRSRVAKFFNSGWVLLNDDSNAVSAVIDCIGNNIQAKVANQVMIASSLILMADATDDVRTREICGYATGRQWLKVRDNGEYCFSIMKNTGSTYRASGEEIYSNMAKYRLGNREMFYNTIIDCFLDGGDENNVDTSDITWGKVPRCYFFMPMYIMVSRDAPKCSDNFDGGHCGENWKVSKFE